MSRKEIDRLEVIQRVVNKGLLQREGEDQLGLSVRQLTDMAAIWTRDKRLQKVARKLQLAFD